MLRLIVARLIGAVPTLFLIVAAAFFLLRLAPGGPFDAERALDPDVAQNLRRIYRLDRPLAEQFWLYLVSLIEGDFGPSLHWRDFSVNELFAKALPVSAALGAEALLAALLIGVALGLAGAGRETGLGARLVDGAAFFGVVLPAFVVAPLLQLGFGLTLHVLPVGGWEGGAWRNQILPVFTLALPQIAIVARLMQEGLRDALALPHIRTLRAFGLPAWHIQAHALRAAVLPALSYLGLAAANVLTGSVVVETIFGIPGMGRYFVDGALGRDYTLVMGTVVIVAALVVFFNLMVDIGYAWLDPRVRDE
ncbi:ABC transporter permease subunit [Methylocapsa acidiphila]|uniref:ABC transporter permease subunit n=1 Tax=Methylocapsa acidiphila TaxID=133552 RepID=UPI0003F6AFA4|nr:ABC transporter permease subunit [Methylocapsa acidiphila]